MLELVLAWATIIGAVWLIFQAMEKTVKPVTKRHAGEWLKGLVSTSTAQTMLQSPHWFVQAFNNIFGERHLTWRCFWRSCVASTLAVVVVTSIWAILDWASFKSSIETDLGWGLTLLILYIICGIFNFIPDYISLLETRWILRRATFASLRRLMIFLVLDVIITGVIFLVAFPVIYNALEVISGKGILTLEVILTSIRQAITFPVFLEPGAPGFSIFFYSTYFTSVWFYLFLLSSIVIRFAFLLGRIGNRLMSLLDIEKKPFLSMGIVATGFITLGFAIAAIINAII